MPDFTYDVGRVSFIMKGAWNLATNYEKLDAVTYDGSLYIAKQDVPGGTAITNTTYWQLAAEKGDQGATGNGIASIAKTGTAGNVDTYTITYTDGTTTTFTVTNGGVTTVNGRTGDVTGLAEEDGSYPLLNAGTADNLTPYSEDSGATQDIPFIAQGTGCGNGESVVDTGSYLQFKKKLGNTVGVNQLVYNGTFAAKQNWSLYNVDYSVSNNEATVTITNGSDGWGSIFQDLPIPSGHKYIALCLAKVGTASKAMLVGSATAETTSSSFVPLFITGESTGNTARVQLRIYGSVGQTGAFKVVASSDLTRWYGSTGRIPSDLLSHPENWGRYYAGSLAYNAGTLDSADGSILTSIHRNIWDEEWELGIYNTSTGAKQSSSTRIRSKNLIPVIPNTQYYFRASANRELLQYDSSGNFIYYDLVDTSNQPFTTLPNCHFIAFSMYSGYGTTYLNNITISLYYPGESGYSAYYPYTVLAEVDTGSEVLRSAGAIADEKTPDGTITRRVIDIDLSTLNYNGATADGRTYSYGLTGIQTPSAGSVVPNVRSAKYIPLTEAGWYAASTPGITITGNGYGSDGQIGIVDPALANMNSAQIQAALSGVHVYAELATSTTEQGTAFAENIPCDDFGSMYWTQTEGIPQGNEIFYPVDYKASIDTLYKKVNGDMSKIVTEDEYPEAPSADGTYVLKATVSGGTKTYAWVAE